MDGNENVVLALLCCFKKSSNFYGELSVVGSLLRHLSDV